MLTKKELLPKIQSTYSEILGAKISKEKAWDIFKASIQEPFEILVENYKAAGSTPLVRGETCDDLVMSLAGVGRFEIITAGTRKGKVEVAEVDPRARLYLSNSIQNRVYSGLGYDQFIVGGTKETATADEASAPEEETEEIVEGGEAEEIEVAVETGDTSAEETFFDVL